jgi:hypothetical protein
MATSWWSPQDDIVPFLQVADEVIRDELGHELIAVPEPASAIALKGHRDRQPEFVRIGGLEVRWIVHAPKGSRGMANISRTKR